MTYKPGDVVLVNFPFTDLVSSKVRPAIVITVKGEKELFDRKYRESQAFLTQLKKKYPSKLKAKLY